MGAVAEMKLIYIASPYSHKDEDIMQTRFSDVRDFTASIMQDIYRTGVVPFSPIVHCHEIAQVHELPKGYDYWLNVDKTFLRHADELWVLMIDGWRESTGVKAEIEFAESILIPVKYCSGE